jgi:hypothetical protein
MQSAVECYWSAFRLILLSFFCALSPPSPADTHTTNRSPLLRGWAAKKEKVADCGSFTNKREVFLEAHNLAPGTYTLIPSTFEPGDERPFVVQAFCMQDVKLEPFVIPDAS